MKHKRLFSLSLIVPLSAVAILSVACKPSSDTDTAQARPATVDQQMTEAQRGASETSRTFQAYTYEQRGELVANLNQQLDELNNRIDELSDNVAKASLAVRAEAEPRLQELRLKAKVLAQQLDDVEKATPSTWDSVKARASMAYDDVMDNFQQARQWVSEKVAP